MKANDIQVGGDHYRRRDSQFQHWDLMLELGILYFPAVITKYVERHEFKKGAEDLDKAIHYCDKWFEHCGVTFLPPSASRPYLGVGVFESRIESYVSSAGLDRERRLIFTLALGARSPADLMTLASILRRYRIDQYGDPTTPPGTPEDGGHHATQQEE